MWLFTLFFIHLCFKKCSIDSTEASSTATVELCFPILPPTVVDIMSEYVLHHKHTKVLGVVTSPG